MFKNADIRPEYVITVEVAKQLIGPDRQVKLEVQMKELRSQARGLSRSRQWRQNVTFASINKALEQYKFGRKDSQRLDIVVLREESFKPPFLLVEIKLGIKNLHGIKKDINRIVRLFEMYKELKLLEFTIYGAVVFLVMEEDNGTGVAGRKTQKLLCNMKKYLQSVQLDQDRLYINQGLLKNGTIIRQVTGYTEHYNDMASEEILAKKPFYFAPVLLLLGNAKDVESVIF